MFFHFTPTLHGTTWRNSNVYELSPYQDVPDNIASRLLEVTLIETEDEMLHPPKKSWFRRSASPKVRSVNCQIGTYLH